MAFAGVFCRTRSAFLEHERAKAELKGLMPEDAKEAMGHGIRDKRSKSGAVKPLKYLAQIGFVSVFFDLFFLGYSRAIPTYGTQASVAMRCGSFLVAAEIAELQKAPQGRSGPAVGRCCCCCGGWVKRCKFRIHHFVLLEHREVYGDLRHRLYGPGGVQVQKGQQPLDQNHLQLPDAPK